MRRLTLEEEQYLIETYPDITVEVEEIAFALDTTTHYVHKMANYRGLKRKPPLGHKYCGRCERILPFTKFYIARTRLNGYSSWCKECEKKYKEEKRISDASLKIKKCNICNIDKPITEYQSRQGACNECLHQKRKIESNLGKYDFDKIIKNKMNE